MSHYLLAVVTLSLRGGSPTQRLIFHHPIECTWELLELYMYARYKSHDDAAVSYLVDALRCVHGFKEDFLLGRASTKAKAKANALRTELVKKRKVDEETNVETGTPSKMQRETNTWQDYISHEKAVSKELTAICNLPKIHLMSHWVKMIH